MIDRALCLINDIDDLWLMDYYGFHISLCAVRSVANTW